MFLTQTIIARPTLYSGLVIFGEWLAVGGEGAGSAEIATMFESWGELMTDNKELRAELFLAYGRAFLQVSQSEEQSDELGSYYDNSEHYTYTKSSSLCSSLQLAKFGDEARGVFRAMLGCKDLSADDEVRLLC